MIDEGAARRAAEAVLAEWPTAAAPDGEIVVWQIDEHSRAWIVHWATRRWLETRAVVDQLVGSCPLVVDKATGEVHQYGSAPDQYDKYAAWLDAPPQSS